MAKVIQLNTNTIENFIGKLLELVENGEVTKIAFAGMGDDPLEKVNAGYFGLNCIEKQWLVTHMQHDVNIQVVRATLIGEEE